MTNEELCPTCLAPQADSVTVYASVDDVELVECHKCGTRYDADEVVDPASLPGGNTPPPQDHADEFASLAHLFDIFTTGQRWSWA